MRGAAAELFLGSAAQRQPRAGDGRVRLRQREPALLHVLIEQRARRFLGLRDVRLVERIDVHQHAGGGRGDLPAQELGADVGDVRHLQVHHRDAVAAQRLARARRPAPPGRARPQPRRGRSPTRAVAGFARRSARRPCPACRCSRRRAVPPTGRSEASRSGSSSVILSRPAAAPAAMNAPSAGPGCPLRARCGRRAPCSRACGEQRVDVGPDQRRRHHAEERQHRVAAADVGRVHEDVAESLAPSRADAARCPSSVMAMKRDAPRAVRPPRGAGALRRPSRSARSSNRTCSPERRATSPRCCRRRGPRRGRPSRACGSAGTPARRRAPGAALPAPGSNRPCRAGRCR